MEDIKLSRIYAIKSFQADKIYIGSTIRTLKQRFSGHKSEYKRYQNVLSRFVSSFELIKYEDCYIELLKEVCCNKRQLLEIEDETIKNNNCVNKYSTKEWTVETKNEYNKEYKKNNKEKTKEYNKIYKKQYREANKTKIQEYNKQYYQNQRKNNMI